ncbi:hypothetical protein K470DRAFT_74841 [Piedraia hortae CBS 480.64]|uniref:Uncharacterized protein n=1 Tax=Piedraia hortae CBS 480.64 TaxID=1314780 RepID=A0A6A7BYT3_9PEZI|nr:hypothetical protein K470DRAFT_74841 [Piedraia hortae CBS 480.64]
MVYQLQGSSPLRPTHGFTCMRDVKSDETRVLIYMRMTPLCIRWPSAHKPSQAQSKRRTKQTNSSASEQTKSLSSNSNKRYNKPIEPSTKLQPKEPYNPTLSPNSATPKPSLSPTHPKPPLH